MAEIKAQCTWGDGPDVLVTLKESPLWLMADPVNKTGDAKLVHGFISTTHGFCMDAQLDLTKEQARSLGISLLESVDEVNRLESELDKINGKDLPTS